MNICKNCRHIGGDNPFEKCTRGDSTINLVTGEWVFPNAQLERMSVNPACCGPLGQFFELYAPDSVSS